MKELQFKELKVDDKFLLDGVQYIRVPEKRISCCRVLNAKKLESPYDFIQVKPLTVVQINDEL